MDIFLLLLLSVILNKNTVKQISTSHAGADRQHKIKDFTTSTKINMKTLVAFTF